MAQSFGTTSRERHGSAHDVNFYAKVSGRFFVCIVALFALCCMAVRSQAAVVPSVTEQSDYEGRVIASVEVAIEGAPRDAATETELSALLRVAPNTEYSAVRVRESLQALIDSGRVSFARVEASPAVAANSPIRLRFIVRRQALVGEVLLDITPATGGTPVSEDELRGRLNMLEPGMRFSEQSLKRSADSIQTYLRDKGFFRATVTYAQQLDSTGTRAAVTFRINPGEQALVAAFNINITGFDPATVRPSLALQTNAPFSRATLGEDINRIRQAVIASGYLAPQLVDPQVTFDTTLNNVTINLMGAIGPKVEVTVRNFELDKKAARELLPVKREGSIDLSAIVEGQRRLRNKLQENGYFFTDVTSVCTVTPPTPATTPNGTEQTCENLNPSELSGRTVSIAYDVNRGRRFKLTDIRLEGTNKLSLDDVPLRTQKATALGFIPFLGYGRGYTSPDLLEEDSRTIRARMRDLGYRRAKVDVRQGVSVNGDNLIITFVVTEGALTRVAGVEIRGNQIYTDKRLREELSRGTCHPEDQPGTTIIGGAFSLSQARADGDCIRNLYARNGYADLQLDLSTVELPKKGADEQVRLVYTISKEGAKVFIGRILVNGNVRTEKEAVLGVTPLKEGAVLRADKIADAERALYSTDAFRQAIVRTEPAGETAAGFAKRDVIIDVEELKPRVLGYGGGFSTDTGAQGFIDLRNVNLFGKLRQGTAQLRGSNRLQLARIEYFDPRFRRYGENQVAPLTISAQYRRDTSVTRFFRSTIDQGDLGVVQRLDERGRPIDEFGMRTGQPTVNRFTFNVQTQRDLELKLGPRGEERKRTTIFLRYAYEDVRLFNINSLLLAPILRPDRAIRLSRIGTTFVRDTRDNKLGDATRGDFLTLDYGLALRQLGGNISFNRLETSYRRFYRIDRFRRTVLAGNVSLGLANLFNPRDRDGNGTIDEIDQTLPISERFFSGGSTTLRGFAFQEAGPRRVITFRPGEVFRNRQREIVTLNPFTVPVGGNALAVINLEARVPVTKTFSVVPFYDGGNVFRRASDLFGSESRPGEDPNLRALFTHTVGLGVRVKTPIGGALAVDYGFLLNPPQFIIPQQGAPDAIFRLKNSQLHFRFSQAF
ncbi:MAG: POTRA domain-containing protein [Pyrinomonadaceae bacterium]